MAAPHARRTSRLTVILRAVAFACGGEQGARLADRLGIVASPDTLLREIRRSPNENCPPVRIVGVDDWALRRGKRYGTILIDLERHRPVDLLPDRSSEAFRVWLQGHPEIEIISRDRGDCYIKGADQGAPQAIQVADRWHLLHNLQEALVQLVDRHRKQLKEAAKSMREPVPVPVDVPVSCVGTGLTKAEQARDQRRQRRLERYQQVLELHGQGLAVREIARQLRMHRRTVRLWLARKTLPERAIPCSRRSVPEAPRRGSDGISEYRPGGTVLRRATAASQSANECSLIGFARVGDWCFRFRHAGKKSSQGAVGKNSLLVAEGSGLPRSSVHFSRAGSKSF